MPRLTEQLVAILLFALLTACYTWPLVTVPGHSLSGLNDPPLFTWILNWVATALYSDPFTVLDGPVFYPYGRTITFSEPLVFPALVVAGPIRTFSDNPILAYNITLLVFQTLSAFAAWFAVKRITGSPAGAVIAGVVYALSSYKMGYYNFINIHLSFAVPLAIVCLIDFLEHQRWRDLFLTVGLTWLQALSIWYATIPLVLLLIIIAVLMVLLRPMILTRRLFIQSSIGIIVFAVLVAPLAWVYWQTSNEMNFSRSLGEVNKFRADLLSYVDSGLFNRWHRFVDAGREPGLFPGFVVCGLSAMMIATTCVTGFWRALKRRQFGLLAWLLVMLALVVIVVVTVWPALPPAIPSAVSMGGSVTLPVGMFMVLLIALMAWRGWSFARQSHRSSTLERQAGLTTTDWAILTLFLLVFSVLLTLGPVIHLNDVGVGRGIYGVLHAYFPGFSGLRIAIRLAFLFLFFAGLMAALMLARLESYHRLTGSVTGLALALVLIVELWPGRITYEDVDWKQPPPVYQRLSELPTKRAVFELPTFDESIDSLYMLWSIKHGKPLVNGVSGFYPPTLQPLAASTQAIPARHDASPLQAVDGLGYLVIHLDKIRRDNERKSWIGLIDRPVPGLRFDGRYGDALLFMVDSNAQPGWRWRQQVGVQRFKGARRLAISVTPFGDNDDEVIASYQLKINEHELNPVSGVDDGRLVFELPALSQRIAPYHLELQQSYDVNPAATTDSRYLIGTTSTHSPVDVVVQSGSRVHGSLATIWVNGINLAMRQPGYNVVVLDGVSGMPVRRAVFDLAKKPEHTQQLINFLANQSEGDIVVLALKDRGVEALDESILTSFDTIGAGRLDPRNLGGSGSHLIIGVRGAPAGSAIEIADTDLVEAVVGTDRRRHAMQVNDWRLEY